MLTLWGKLVLWKSTGGFVRLQHALVTRGGGLRVCIEVLALQFLFCLLGYIVLQLWSFVNMTLVRIWPNGHAFTILGLFSAFLSAPPLLRVPSPLSLWPHASSVRYVLPFPVHP